MDTAASTQPVQDHRSLDDLGLPSVQQCVAAARRAEFEERAGLALGAATRVALQAVERAGEAQRAPHVCYLMPRTDVGGGARIIIEHANRLGDAGLKVTVLSHFPRPEWMSLRADFEHVPFGQELAEAIPDCDVVVAGYWDQIIPARLRGVAPVVHFEQGDSHLFEKQPPDRERLVTANLVFADATMTLNAANAEILSTRYSTAATVIANAVDAAVFRPAEPAQVTAAEPGQRYLLVVGWDGNAFKSLDDAFAAHQRLRDEGRDLDLVWVTPHPPVTPRGHVVVAPSQEELARLYQGAAVYLHSSHYEAFGLPPLEAMSCGAPVVATRNSGVSAYAVHGENCLLVDIGDVVAMAAAVAALLDDPPLAASCAEGGRVTSGRYTWSAITDELEGVYRRWATWRPDQRARDAWTTDLRGLAGSDEGAERRLAMRLATTTARHVAVPVAWPAIEGHDVVSWRVVASRDGGDDRIERVLVPHRANRPPRGLTYGAALRELVEGRPDRALTKFVAAHRAAEGAVAKAAIGRWVVLALLEAGRDGEALQLAVQGAHAHPDYTDYHYLAAAIAAVGGLQVDPRADVAQTVSLLGPATRFPEWFADTPGLLKRLWH